MELNKVGTFEIVSGHVVISDPCYKLGTWCQGQLKNVNVGKWIGYVTKCPIPDWGSRVCDLVALSKEMTTKENFLYYIYGLEVYNWQKENFEVGVDSGQAGIYDKEEYRGGERGGNYGDGGWYDKCCKLTVGIFNAGVLPMGIISSSGFGDGGYNCFTIKNSDDKIVGIRIQFIGPEDLK